MLEYINTGTTNDMATESIDIEIKEAIIQNIWREEYMLTLVHDKDVFRDGFVEGREEGKAEGREEGRDAQALQVYQNCIERGMTKEEAISISGIKPENIP